MPPALKPSASPTAPLDDPPWLPSLAEEAAYDARYWADREYDPEPDND